MLSIKCFPALLLATVTLAQAQAPAVNPADVASIDSLMDAYYESVSGHPGKRDADRMLSLFVDGGKMGIRLSGDEPIHQLAEEYVYTEGFLTISTDFFEREISRDTQQFGQMANVISTYGISDAMENTDYTARGVTVFQLVQQNGRWWILSTLFQRESAEFPLPAELLD